MIELNHVGDLWGLLLIASISGVLLILISFLFNKYVFVQKKGKSNKLLLKELLESFGLEVPSELEEPTPDVIKTVKGS
tara:strand:+ start:186 stop:419 length:234 start_codon:yes stop_codon:yes gene_type:complete